MELWFRAPAGGFDNGRPGLARLAITALAASSPPHGTSLAELVNRFGGSLSIGVYPDIAMVGVSVPAWDAPQVLRVLTSAYFRPHVATAGFKAALRDCALAAAQTRFDPERLLEDALFRRLFSAGPARVAPTPSEASDFSRISMDAVQAFAQRAFRQNNAVLSLAGAVDTQLLGSVRGGNPGAPPDAPFDSVVAPTPGATSQPSLVAGTGFAWAGAPIADAKAATALDFVADYLFNTQHGTFARAFSQAHKNAYVHGQFITLHNPGVLLLTISGVDVPDVRTQVADAVSALRRPMDGARFAAARAAFEYRILSETQTPMSRADNYGWYAAEGDAGYAPASGSGEYERALQALDPAFVAQTVAKYLQHPAIVQLLPSEQKGTSA